MTRLVQWLLLPLCLPGSPIGQVRFSASTERTKIAMGEQAAIVATLVTDRQIPDLAIPQVSSGGPFTVLKTHRQQSSSSSIQIINGKAVQKNEITTQFYYFIAPKQTGSFTFPALSVTIDGTPYQTEPLLFTVTNEPVTNPDVRAFLTLAKRSLYSGEQSLLTYKVAQRAQAQGSSDVRNGFNGALDKIEQAFGKNFALTRLFTNQITSGSERIDGEMYNVYSLRFLLFPLTAGSYTIPAIPFEYQELRRSRRRRSIDPFFDDFFGGDFFGGGVQAIPKTVFTGALAVEVKSLPPPPAGFTGAVGSFSLQASADPREVPAGESVTLKAALKGNTRPGNIGDITVPRRDDYELFTPEKMVVVDTGATGLSTRKLYKYLLVPKHEGSLTIDPIVFHYFDPKTASYKTASSDPIKLTVTKGRGVKKEQTRYLTQEEIREVGRDIRYIKTSVALKHQSRHPYREPLFYLLYPLPLVFLGLSLLYRFQSTRRERNFALQLRNRALASALRQIAKIKKQASTPAPNDLLGRLTATIETYISQKFGFPATGRTLDELKEELLRSTRDEKTVAELTRFIEQIDGYRFGGMTLDHASQSSIVNQAAAFLTGLEKGAKKEKKR
ncbi:MAG: protein BatD [Chitinispirillaceae bacterium]|nr:protein BatD [Chitinispirillaceae bacterium]